MKVGLYFGSFNPVHVGHMIIANQILNFSDLDQVWIVVSPHNPLKKKKSLANDFDRLHLVNLAIGNNTKIKASNRRGGKKYIKQESTDINYFLDQAAIDADSAFDGYYAIATDQDELAPEDVIAAYHNLYKIEQSFRIMKTSLEVEPIFVWTPKRIKGHFVICFLAFLLERHLEFKLQKNNVSA